ncbi:MAG: hypothetical protein AAGE80_17475 [Pseudomonadota bacterium]
MFGKALRIACIAAVLSSTQAAAAGSVVINGMKLDAEQISWLEVYACGPIYPGNYWLDVETGLWGYRGVPQSAGHIRERCAGRPSKNLRDLGPLPAPAKYKSAN